MKIIKRYDMQCKVKNTLNHSVMHSKYVITKNMVNLIINHTNIQIILSEDSFIKCAIDMENFGYAEIKELQYEMIAQVKTFTSTS